MESTPKKLGKYEIRTLIGRGAMGVVYQAYDPDIERNVAIKVLHEHLLDTQEGKSYRQRFKREAQAAAKCPHPNIVTVFELGQEKNRDYIVMEYVQGEELKYFMESGYGFTRAEIGLIGGEVLKALSAAHRQGIVHRDIKPANIILMDDGNVKVADFGIARLDHSDLTSAGNAVGTPSYMSPEGLRGEAVDHRADLFSAAMVILELLSGRKPQSRDIYSRSIAEFVDEVFTEFKNQQPLAEFESLLRKGLAENKEDRFDSADALRTELDSLMSNSGEDHDAATERLSDTVTAMKPLSREKSAAGVEWNEAVLKDLETELASYIGPLAKVLVERSVSTETDPESLVTTLAGHIENEAERSAFARQAKRNLSSEQSVRDTDASGKNATLFDTLNPEQLDQFTRKLAFYLGPFAKRLVIEEAKKHTDQNAFCEALAAKIQSEREKEEFLKSAG